MREKVLSILDAMCYEELAAVEENYVNACDPLDYESRLILDFVDYIVATGDDLGIEAVRKVIDCKQD